MPENFLIRSQEDVRELEKLLLSTYLSVPLTPVLKTVAKDLEELHDQYFEAEAGPGGRKWAPNSPATIARKGHGDVLQETLKMRLAMTKASAAGAVREVLEESSFAAVVHGLDVDEVPYWKYHDQPGGSLPWRPFIGVTPAEVDAVGERVLDHIVEGMVQRA